MPMELKDKDVVGSDDEEDLEKLRLAALQSLKRPVPIPNPFKKSPQGIKRRNFGRNRNGLFRIKNTNLISIPTIDDPIVTQRKKDEVKLVLPQDRYCNIKKEVDEKSESTSKFDRYDKSDSESEYESETGSESESPGKLERASSLEALMQELENEIQGKTQSKSDSVDIKKKIKKRKKKIEVKEIETIETKPEKPETIEEGDNKTNEMPVLSPKSDFPRKQSPLNPRIGRNFNKYPKNRNIYQTQYPPPLNLNPIPFPLPLPYTNPVIYNPLPYIPTPNLIPNPAQIPLNPIEPPRIFYERPLSPLSLNTDDALTIARAPLSPRSAAFVLQNRDVIERRKKSPRRSYSRSPSPRYHRSKSKERSPKFAKSRSRTPLKDERRVTPVKEVRKRSPIGRRRSVERRSPENNGKKKMVKERLGMKKKRSKSPSPVPPPKLPKIDDEKIDPVLEARKKKFESNEIKNKEGIIRLKPKTDENKVEVIKKESEEKIKKESEEKIKKESGEKMKKELEEKMKKESEDKMKKELEEKMKKESEEKMKKELEENVRKEPEEKIQKEPEEKVKNDMEKTEKILETSDELEENIDEILNAKVDDIFSDEETDEENEGRFKNSVVNEKTRTISVLPFAKLIDTNKSVKTDLLARKERTRSPLRSRDAKNYVDSAKSKSVTNKVDYKEKLVHRTRPERKEKLVAPIENKKIEIKIRNPSKYETTSKYDVANKNEVKERSVEKPLRKVEVAKKSDDEGDNIEAKINLDSEDDDVVFNQKCDSGDLRAQLSRKRAERQNRLPAPENVPSRLLQNALQGAVFKKQKKAKPENDAAPKDGKVPVHLRLGAGTPRSHKKPRRKNRPRVRPELIRFNGTTF